MLPHRENHDFTGWKVSIGSRIRFFKLFSIYTLYFSLILHLKIKRVLKNRFVSPMFQDLINTPSADF